MSDILSKPIKPLIPGSNYNRTCSPSFSETSIEGNPCGEVVLRDLGESRLETFSLEGEAWPFGSKENASTGLKTLPEAPSTVSMTPKLEPIQLGKKTVKLANPNLPPKLEPISPAKKTVELANPNQPPKLEVKPKKINTVGTTTQAAKWDDTVAETIPGIKPPYGGVAQWAEDTQETVNNVTVMPESSVPVGQAVWDTETVVEAHVENKQVEPVIPALVPLEKKEATKTEIPPLLVRARDVYAYLILGYNEVEDYTAVHGIYLPDELNRLPGANLKEKLDLLCKEKFDKWDANDSFAHKKAAGTLKLIRSEVRQSDATNLLAKNEVYEILEEGSSFVIYTFKAVRFKMNNLGTMLKFDQIV